MPQPVRVNYDFLWLKDWMLEKLYHAALLMLVSGYLKLQRGYIKL